ncbi:MAG: AAA family ATPase, partial [Azorhizobium sp. 12-66-6]
MPALAPLTEQLRFGEKIEVAFTHLSEAELDFLQHLYRGAGPQMQTRVAQIATLQRAFSDKSVRFAANDLESVVPAIARYLIADAIHGWMFTASVASRPLPYVVTRLDYTPPSNDETGRVFVELKANAKGAITSTTLRISGGEIAGKTVAEIFAAKGFLKETPELIAAYEETEA